MNDDRQVMDHLRKIATPTRMMQEVALDTIGRPYQVYPWLLYVEMRVLAAIARPGRKIVIVNVPSQQGKTTFSGFALPSWYLGMNTQNQVLLITHGEEYSGQWGARCYNLLKKHGQRLFGVEMSRQHASVNNWRTAGGFGGMISTGILSGIVGNPGHLVIIDDVLPSIEAATSPTILKKQWAEFTGTIEARAQMDTTFLITATRFHEEDLSGMIIARSKEPGYAGFPVEVITVKAFAEPDDDDPTGDDEDWVDFLGRHRGEALEGQHDAEFFHQRRASLVDGGQEQQWDAIYQGNPTANKNGMFPKLNWEYINRSELPQMMATVRVWDLATTEGGGDWTVGTLMGRDAANRFFVIDVIRQRYSTSKVEKLVLDAAKADGFGCKIKIEQERAGAGISVVEAYQRKLIGYQVEPAKAETSKESRATPYSNEQQKHNIYLVRADWNKEFVDEHKKMMGDGRRPRHDDQIDTGAYAFLELMPLAGVDIYIPSPGDGLPSDNAQMRVLTGQAVPAGW